MLEGTLGQFLGWTKSFESHRHEVREIDPKLSASAQGDPQTRYFYSDWEIGEDEAFVVDLEPPKCDYSNLQIENHWLESFDFMSFATHLNPATAVWIRQASTPKAGRFPYRAPTAESSPAARPSRHRRVR